MIKKFDKSGAAALYKRKFAEHLEDNDYEGALDDLLKFSQETDNPEFHLACGKLFLLMTQDSDDPEFVTMAYRELLMYLSEHPDCEYAYRDLLAVSIIRNDAALLAMCCDFISKHGYDRDAMLETLARAGVNIIPSDEDLEYYDIADSFEEGEFGTIDKCSLKKGADTQKPSEPQKTRVIPFRGGNETPEPTKKPAGKAKKSDGDGKDGLTPYFDELLDVLRKEHGVEISGKFDSGDTAEIDIRVNGEDSRKIEAGWALTKAERLVGRGKYDEAFKELDNIKPADGHLYYCAECVRAYIFLEQEKFVEAMKALNSALKTEPGGALAGTLKCRCLEETGREKRIPKTLREIDVRDFIDADHVYRAANYAIKYCGEDEALELLAEYIDEFNITDVRLLYAQLLYNAGEKDEALHELYLLTRIYYDDFNIEYFYLMAKMGVDRMPLKDDIPQQLIGYFVDSLIELALGEGGISDDVLNSEVFDSWLEIFMTLVFSNRRKVMKSMFAALRALARDRRLERKMRFSLVSPYVEAMVKGVILSELIVPGEHFLAETCGCMIDEKIAALKEGLPRCCYEAFAFVAAIHPLRAQEFCTFIEEKDVEFLRDENPTDGTYYLLCEFEKRAKLSLDDDDRLPYALGYDTKSVAKAAYRSLCARRDRRN